MPKKEMICDNNIIKFSSKKAQLSIFIILGIVIFVVVLTLLFFFRENVFGESVPSELASVYSYYLSCIQEEGRNGVNIISASGGYINNPAFSPGSFYMPFSSQLGFVGLGIHYWSYISANGINREQVPTKSLMQEELNIFLEDRIQTCDFSDFRERGYEINISETQVNSIIHEDRIQLDVQQSLSISYGTLTWSKNTHDVEVNSNLGKLYDLSKEIYDKEKETLFLEEYGVDVLRLYAPVDGSEISCSPKIWQLEDVRGDLVSALESNVMALKVKGDYYDLSAEENKYFITELDTEANDINVNFLFSRNFPHKIEAYPNEGELLRADPVGMQEGLGILGFCYVPYHFVYDIYYPVLIQVYTNEEIFQFPVVVSIDNNQPLGSNASSISSPNAVDTLCQYRNMPISVYTYNNNLEPISASLSFKCFDTTCPIGPTKIEVGDSKLLENFPQCINGSIIAEAQGYEGTSFRISSLNQNSAVIVLKKIYTMDLEVRTLNQLIDGKGEYALVSFTKDNQTKTISYPEQKQISLSEGQYEVKVYVYSDSNISISGSTSEKCVSVPKSGFLGVLGASEEKCFDIDIPSQVLSYSVYGGGIENYYVSDSELASSNKLSINAQSFSVARKIEDLQINYNKVGTSGLDIIFQ